MPNRTQHRGKPPAGGELWLHGRHAVAAALANRSRTVRRLLQTEAGDAAAAARRRGIPVETVERRLLDRRFGTGAVHQGIALQCDPLPPPDLEAIAAEPGPARLLLLDRVSDPRNVGAVLRSAEAFGVRAVILPAAGAPAESAALAKAAAGALERVPLARVVNLARTLERLKAAGYWFVALDGTADLALDRLDLAGRVGLVLGAEGAGIRRLVRRACDFEAAIPMSGGADSLNVAVAAGIALYEAHRQTYMGGEAAEPS